MTLALVFDPNNTQQPLTVAVNQTLSVDHMKTMFNQPGLQSVEIGKQSWLINEGNTGQINALASNMTANLSPDNHMELNGTCYLYMYDGQPLTKKITVQLMSGLRAYLRTVRKMKPKRPRNAFQVFSSEHQRIIRTAMINEGVTPVFSEICKRTNERWKGLSTQSKELYNDKHKQYASEFEVLMVEYNNKFPFNGLVKTTPVRRVRSTVKSAQIESINAGAPMDNIDAGAPMHNIDAGAPMDNNTSIPIECNT